MLYIASDHGGLDLKSKLIHFLRVVKGIEIEDIGPATYTHDDDYPDYVTPLAKKIQEDLQNNKGILICRNGVGVCMLANKYKGIRAGLSWDPSHVSTAKTDDNINVLCLPADFIDNETAKYTIQNWLDTPFSNEDRHIRRLKKVEAVENNAN